MTRVNHPHMVRTEVETLEEAIGILAKRKWHKRGKYQPTLKQELQRNELRQMHRPVSLSDRTIPSYICRKEKVQKETVVWTREQVQAAYKSGYFKPGELAQRAKVRTAVIWEWIK